MTVSTRSRPKAAGAWVRPLFRKWLVSTRSRPKAAGYVKYYEDYSEEVSTRSRPKAAGGSGAAFCRVDVFVSTRSRPKAAGKNFKKETDRYKFQHAAARRRLVYDSVVTNLYEMVSTRSRPKAAGEPIATTRDASVVSTRSRPKAAGTVTLKRPRG